MLVSKTKPCTCKTGIGAVSAALIVNLWTAHYNSYTRSHWYVGASQKDNIVNCIDNT